MSEKLTRNDLDYAVESRGHGIALCFDRIANFAHAILLSHCHTAGEQYNLGEPGLKKEIPD